MHITSNEMKVLRTVCRNDFTGANGALPKNYSEASDWIWSDCINESRFPSGIEGRALSGVVSSLCQKGLLQIDGNSGRDACVRLTEQGFNEVAGTFTE